MKKQYAIPALVLLIILVIGAIVYATQQSDTPPDATPSATVQENTTEAQDAQPAETTGVVPSELTITYDGNSFSIPSNTVKSGGKVTVVNQSNMALEFDSNPHPQHTDQPELNAGLIPAGQSKSFTLNQTGTWGFHNHLNPSQSGEITVK